MFNKKTHSLNAFKVMRVPTSRQLFERFGFSLAPSGHPDNTDPNHWTTPSNPSCQTQVGLIGVGGQLTDRFVNAAKAKEAEQQQQQQASKPEDLPE